MSEERQNRLVVFGATGFTGTLTAEYLADHAPADLSWAIAGRNESKLRELQGRLASRPSPPARIIIAHTDDEASIRAMVRSTHVLATTVGPFDRYGEPVVRACVEEIGRASCRERV